MSVQHELGDRCSGKTVFGDGFLSGAAENVEKRRNTSTAYRNGCGRARVTHHPPMTVATDMPKKRAARVKRRNGYVTAVMVLRGVSQKPTEQT